METFTKAIASFFDTESDGLLAFEHERNVVFLNEAMARIAGIPKSEARGKRLQDIFPFDALPCSKASDITSIDGKHVVSGARGCYEVTCTCLREEPSEEPIGGVALVHRSAVRAGARELGPSGPQIEQELDYCSVVHDLRSPLSSLKLVIDHTLRTARARALKQEEILGKLTAANRQIERMSAMLQELMGSGCLAGERVDLAEVLRAALACVQTEESAEGLFRLRGESPVMGPWDAALLSHVFVNLLSNALKYGRGEPVDVWVEDGCDVARVRVRDRGIGIARQDLRRIFEPYTRAAPAGMGDGWGLGLWIVRQNVARLGGTVSVTSELGKGSEFVVELPK